MGSAGRGRHTAPGFSTQLLQGEMRNCLSDPKPEFTAALHYGFLQEALGATQLGRAHLLAAAAPASVAKHVGGFLPGAAGAGGPWAARGGLPAVPQPPHPRLPV